MAGAVAESSSNDTIVPVCLSDNSASASHPAEATWLCESSLQTYRNDGFLFNFFPPLTKATVGEMLIPSIFTAGFEPRARVTPYLAFKNKNYAILVAA